MNNAGKNLLAALLLGILISGVSACQKKDGAMERAGKDMDRGVEKAGQKIDRAVEKSGEKIEKAGEKIKESVEHLAKVLITLRQAQGERTLVAHIPFVVSLSNHERDTFARGSYSMGVAI